MKKYNAIVVDDEHSAREIIEKLLTKFCPQINLICTCTNLEEAVAVIKENKPELVFLDIEMPNYAGYEITRFFDEINFEIIFVTAYDKYALKAFEVSAVDYILKPIDIIRLKEAVSKFENKKNLSSIHKNYQILKENLSKSELTKIIIPYKGDQKIISISTIIAFEAEEAYTKIHLADGESILASKNLKHFENLLLENKSFFRSHKSWLINVNAIQSYSKSNLLIELKEGIVSKLSKYKKSDFELIVGS